VDPVTASQVNGGNFNRYWYGNNNPYSFVDPDGRFATGGPNCSFQIYCDGRNPHQRGSDMLDHMTPVPDGIGESSRGSPEEKKAVAATEKEAGEDGVVELDYESDFLDVWRFEVIRINAMDSDVGWLAGLGPYTFLNQIARVNGDSSFYGPPTGGRLFRITGAPAGLGEGPHLGGNLNYVNIGMIFAAGGRSKNQAIGAVRLWNTNDKSGTPAYRETREKMAAYGYHLWGQLNER